MPITQYFDYSLADLGGRFQNGMARADARKRQNAMLDLQQKQYGLQENKFNYEKEADARSRSGRVASLEYYGFPRDWAERLADDPDFPELAGLITGKGGGQDPAAKRMAQWLANEATPRERAAVQYLTRGNTGKTVDVAGVSTLVNANLNPMPDFDSFGPASQPVAQPRQLIQPPRAQFGGGSVPGAAPVVRPPGVPPAGGATIPLSSLDKEAAAKAALAAAGESGKAIVARLDKMYEDAQSSQTEIQAISEAEKLLDQGVIAGTAGDIRLTFGRALATMGIGSGDEVARTDAYLAATAGLVAKVIKEFGAGTGLSDADREYAAKMAAGQIQLTPQSMKNILGIRRRAANAVIERYNKGRERVISNPAYTPFGDLYAPIETDGGWEDVK